MGWTIVAMLAVQAAAPCPPAAPIGKPLALHRDAALSIAPAKPPPPGSYAGTMPLSVDRAGTYRIAIGQPAWIDVVRDGKAVASTAHGHGKACSGIAKFVEFRLDPGAYTVEVSGANASAIRVAITRR